MSWLSRLFGGTAPATDPAAPAKPLAEAEHGGFTIRAEPFAEAGQFQTAGTIVAIVDGEERQHRFVRADRFGSADDAAAFSLQKGRQIIDEQGRQLFPPRSKG